MRSDHATAAFRSLPSVPAAEHQMLVFPFFGHITESANNPKVTTVSSQISTYAGVDFFDPGVIFCAQP
jgi:hypothetical protein